MAFDDVENRMRERAGGQPVPPTPSLERPDADDGWQQQVARERRERSQRDIMWGALLCVGGIIITAVTYGNASNGGGGTYVVAYGPIIYGAIRLFRGLAG